MRGEGMRVRGNCASGEGPGWRARHETRARVREIEAGGSSRGLGISELRLWPKENRDAKGYSSSIGSGRGAGHDGRGGSGGIGVQLVTAVTTPGVDSGTGEDSGPCTGGTGCVLPDSGTVDSGPCQGGTGCTMDSGTVDSATPPPANLVLAHTAPGVPPFRVCFSTATAGSTATVLPLSALPDSVPGAGSGPPAYPQTGPYPGVAQGTPGIYPGTIGAFPSLGESYKTFTVTPYAILASSITNDVNYDAGNGINTAEAGAVEEDCVALIGTHGLGPGETSPSTPGRLIPNQDFFQLPDIKAGTLLDSQTYLLTVNGCLPGGTPGAAGTAPEPATFACGPAYDGGNSANIGVVVLDTATQADGGNIAVQFAHRSVALENTPIVPAGATQPLHDPASAGVWPLFLQLETYPIDAGEDAAPDAATTATSYVPVYLSPPPGPGVTYSGAGVTPSPAVSLPIAVGSPSTTLFGVQVLPLDGGAPNFNPWPGAGYDPGTGAPLTGDLLALPLSDIQVLSSWNASTASAGGGAAFSLGQTYTFVLTGDPAAPPIAIVYPDGGTGPNPQYDGRGLHILAFPNTFVPLPAPGQ